MPQARESAIPSCFFKNEIVLFQVDADRAKALEIDILAHQPAKVSGPPGIGSACTNGWDLAIATVGGPTTGLHVSNAISVWTDTRRNVFWVHGARTDFHVIRLLEGRTPAYQKCESCKIKS